MKKTFKPGCVLSPLPAVMVTCGTGDEENIITVAWTGVINSEPPMVSISIRPSRYSHDIIEKNGEFVINIPSESQAYITDWCGVKSGRDFNKFKEMELTPIPSEMVACPTILECPIALECKIFDKKELPSHTMYMAEVVNMRVSEELVLESGKIDFEKAHLLAYVHGEYYGMRKNGLGRMGFSVMKAKTKKRVQKEEHEKRVANNKKKREAKATNNTEKEEKNYKKGRGSYSKDKKSGYNKEKKNYYSKDSEKRTYHKDGEFKRYDRDNDSSYQRKDKKYSDRKKDSYGKYESKSYNKYTKNENGYSSNGIIVEDDVKKSRIENKRPSGIIQKKYDD